MIKRKEYQLSQKKEMKAAMTAANMRGMKAMTADAVDVEYELGFTGLEEDLELGSTWLEEDFELGSTGLEEESELGSTGLEEESELGSTGLVCGMLQP